MSEIDNSKHLLIGSFLGLPLYQLLEDNNSLAHRNPQDRHQMPQHFLRASVPKGALVIGGGSGEHPAIALYDPTHCVARYLQFCLEARQSEIDAELERACANMQGDLQTLEYCNWTNQDHLDFRQRCGFFYRYQDELTFEGWLLISVGEFIFHMIPSFNNEIDAWYQKYADAATYWFNIVTIPYEKCYGGNGRYRFKIVDTEN